MQPIQRGHLGPQEQQEILVAIGRELLTTASDDWETVTYTAWALAGYVSDYMEETRRGGATEATDIPVSVIGMVEKLRAGMYEQGKGTWYTLTYTITRPGSFKADYDYDNRPEFTFYPAYETFVHDLQQFPRDDEHIPDWLRDHVEKAAEEG